MLFLDQHHIVDQLAYDPFRQVADILYGNALSDTGAARIRFAALKARAHPGIHRRFDPDHTQEPVVRLCGCRHARNQSATPNRHDQRVEFRLHLEHFEGSGALPGHDFRIVEGMNPGQAFALSDTLRVRIGLIKGMAFK